MRHRTDRNPESGKEAGLAAEGGEHNLVVTMYAHQDTLAGADEEVGPKAAVAVGADLVAERSIVGVGEGIRDRSC